MTRRLVAALACRVNGTRLYGKPLQLLDIDRGLSVLEYMVALLRSEPSIADIVLGVAVGTANEVFHEIAAGLGLSRTATASSRRRFEKSAATIGRTRASRSAAITARPTGPQPMTRGASSGSSLALATA